MTSTQNPAKIDRSFAQIRRSHETQGYEITAIEADGIVIEGFHAERTEGTVTEQVQVMITAPNGRRVVKSGKTVVWTCGHAHHNRDESSVRNGVSAKACAGLFVTVAEHPDYLAACHQAASTAMPGAGFTPDFFARLTAAEEAVATLRAAGTIR